MENLEMQKIIDERIKKVVPEMLDSSSFTQRKITDTPTDDLAVVNRKYVNLNGASSARPTSSVIGQQYFDTTLGYPVFWNGSTFVGANGIVAGGSSVKTGNSSYAGDSASSTQNIAHGLGRTPVFIRVYAIKQLSNITAFSDVSYDGTTQYGPYWTILAGSSTSISGANTAVTITDDTGLTNRQEGVLSWDGTNIIITWTKTGSPSSNLITIFFTAY